MNIKLASVSNSNAFNQDLNFFVNENQVKFLSYTAADMKFVKELDDFLGFHVIRDPRDIVVSAYFSHLHSHPTKGWPALAEHRAKLQKVSKEEGLFLEMDFRQGEFEVLYNWNYSQPNVLELKMEDVIISPYDKIVEALSHLGIVETSSSAKRRLVYLITASMNRFIAKAEWFIPPRMSRKKIPVEILLGYIFENRFSHISRGRQRGEEDVRSHYRKGVTGDWVNHFSEKHRCIFKKKYNDLLTKLAYEKSAKW